MSHSRAGRGNGLTSRGAVLKYLSTKITTGQDEDLDSRGHGQTGTWPGMAVLAQAGSKGETLSYDKANVAEVSQSQTPLLLKLDLSPASHPGGEYVQGPDIILSSLLAAILHSMLAPCSSAREQSSLYGCVGSTSLVAWVKIRSLNLLSQLFELSSIPVSSGWGKKKDIFSSSRTKAFTLFS